MKMKETASGVTTDQKVGGLNPSGVTKIIKALRVIL